MTSTIPVTTPYINGSLSSAFSTIINLLNSWVISNDGLFYTSVDGNNYFGLDATLTPEQIQAIQTALGQ